MIRVIEHPRVEFLNVTKEMQDITESEPTTELWQCWFNKTYIGFIGWDEDIEQYAYFPVVDDQLILTLPVLNDIMLKVYVLMKDRKLN